MSDRTKEPHNSLSQIEDVSYSHSRPSSNREMPDLASPAVQRRNPRRTLEQREAAVKLSQAALAKDRRRMQTRGRIIAGTLLSTFVKRRPDLKGDVLALIGQLSERDREALLVFEPEWRA